jgi:predicted nucleic acid-binding protein
MHSSTLQWVCVDASFLVPLVTQPASNSPWTARWSAWHQQGMQPIAPTLLYYEVANVLFRMANYAQITRDEADEALNAALGLDIVLVGDTDLHKRACKLATQFALPATYDAHYLALAERMQAEFWTGDRRLHQVVSKSLPWVHLLMH